MPKTAPVSTKRSIIGSFLMIGIFLAYGIYNMYTLAADNTPRLNSYLVPLDNSVY